MYSKAEYFICNQSVYKTAEAQTKEFEKGMTIYEVVKIVQGIPIFMEAHIERLRRSAILQNKKLLFSNAEIAQSIFKLVEINNIKEGRLKFAVQYLEDKSNLFVFFLPPLTPPAKYYREGVEIKLFPAERIKPNAKTEQTELRKRANKFIADNAVFEALYYNNAGFISECSKSNIFFVKDNKLYTSLSKNVLVGITRKYIFEICAQHSIEIIEKNIHSKDLKDFDAAFISGTSLGILPVKNISEVSYKIPCALSNFLAEKYNAMLEEDIELRRISGLSQK